MKLLDLTLESPAANVALDEALLESGESGQLQSPVLRLWEPVVPMVVLGRSSVAAKETNLNACRENQIPVIRRCSGGAAILTAPGCLMYAVLLSYRQYPQLRMLDEAHRFVMERIQAAIGDLGIDTSFQGTCDLTIGNRKVSGNALRCKKHWLIYHGTLICEDMDLSLISKYLGTPNRQPEYRRNRSHEEFLTAIPCSTTSLKNKLPDVWKCDSQLQTWPQQVTDDLVTRKYDLNEWTFKI